MTGLLNRGSYDQALKALTKQQTLDNYSIIIMDINGLKTINDSHGHIAGDELIIAAAHAIARTFSSLGDCYRIGGDEFAVIVKQPIDDEHTLFDEFVKINSHWKGQYSARLSLAWGLEYFSQHPNKTVEEVVRLADHKMYQLKEEYYLSLVDKIRQS